MEQVLKSLYDLKCDYNKKLEKEGIDFKVLKSAEVNILKDGSLDIDRSVLAQLDFVAAAVHSHFNMTSKEITNRICTAIRNPLVDIIFHPTGRLILKRPASLVRRKCVPPQSSAV